MEDRTKVQLAALAGAGVLLFGVWYLGSKQRQAAAPRARGPRHGKAGGGTVAAHAPPESTCECGLTMAQGGCRPASSSSSSAYNPQLLGTVKKYEKHFVICAGTEADQWGAKIDRDKGSFASAAKRAISSRKKELTYKFKITNSDERSKSPEGTDLIVFPEGIRYLGVTEETLQFIVEDHLIKGQVSERVAHEPFNSQLVLVCCHGNRDTRCGSQGPIIVSTFKKLLSERGISEDKVTVRQSSHLGGHKYAGVVVVYPQGDWFGFITEAQVESLLDNYIEHGVLVPEHWRGRMGIGKDEAKQLATSG